MSKFRIQVVVTSSRMEYFNRSSTSGVLSSYADQIAGRLAQELIARSTLGEGIRVSVIKPESGSFEEIIAQVASWIDSYEATEGITSDIQNIYVVLTISGVSGDTPLLMPDRGTDSTLHLQSYLAAAAQTINSSAVQLISWWPGFPMFKFGMTYIKPSASGIMELQQNPVMNENASVDLAAQVIIDACETASRVLLDDIEATLPDAGTSDDIGSTDPTSDDPVNSLPPGSTNTTTPPVVVPDTPTDSNLAYREFKERVRSKEFPNLYELIESANSLYLDTVFQGKRNEIATALFKSDDIFTAIRTMYGGRIVSAGSPALFPANIKMVLQARVIFPFTSNPLYLALGNNNAAEKYKPYVSSWFEYYLGDAVLKQQSLGDILTILAWYCKFSSRIFTSTSSYFEIPYTESLEMFNRPVLEVQKSKEWWRIDLLTMRGSKGDRTVKFNNVTSQKLIESIVYSVKTEPVITLERPFKSTTLW